MIYHRAIEARRSNCRSRPAKDSAKSQSTREWNGMAPHSADEYLCVTARHCRIDREDHWLDVCLDTRPACSAQNDNGNSASRQVLLVLEIGVGSDEYRKTSLLGGEKELTVLKRRPSTLVCSSYLMRGQELAKR